MTKDTKTCSGHCCKAFQIGGKTYEELGIEYQLWLQGARGLTPVRSMTSGHEPTPRHALRPAGEDQLQIYDEIHLIYPMLIPLGRMKQNPEKLIVTESMRQSPGWEESDDQGVDFFTCKHLSPEGNCTIYEIRPNMCRRYGVRRDCEFEDCTWEGHTDVTRKRAKQLSERLVQLKSPKQYAAKKELSLAEAIATMPTRLDGSYIEEEVTVDRSNMVFDASKQTKG